MGRERINLLGKMRNLQHELEVMKEHLDEEYDAKQEVERQLSKAFADIQLWKTRYETEGVARAEEIERDILKWLVGWLKPRTPFNLCKKRLPLLKKPKLEPRQNLMTLHQSVSATTPMQLSLRKEAVTLTRLSMSGDSKQRTYRMR